jgi:phage portal protein BeeE
LIGDTAQAKGWSTMEQTMTEFLQLSLTPYLVRIENAIATRLLPGDYRRYAKFNAAGLLRGDLGARANFYKTMNMLGAMNANEIRAKEDLNAIEGGDTYYVQANMTPTLPPPANNGDSNNGQ